VMWLSGHDLVHTCVQVCRMRCAFNCMRTHAQVRRDGHYLDLLELDTRTPDHIVLSFTRDYMKVCCVCVCVCACAFHTVHDVS
jgi:hypothetical protein